MEEAGGHDPAQAVSRRLSNRGHWDYILRHSVLSRGIDDIVTKINKKEMSEKNKSLFSATLYCMQLYCQES